MYTTFDASYFINFMAKKQDISINLPEYWQEELKKQKIIIFNPLGVLYKHRDGTRCVFRHSTFIISILKKEVLILTSQCGYHIFPIDDHCEFKLIEEKEIKAKYSHNEMEDSYPEETKIRLKIPYKVIKNFWRKIFGGSKNA